MLFQESTSRAVVNVVSGALRNSDYFAREEMLVSGSNDSVYVLAECWETLSPGSCKACLENASSSITKCLPWSEGRVLNTGCFMRCDKKELDEECSYDAEELVKTLNDISLNFKYSTIEKATENWDESNKLGQGGNGTVYKGVLSDGREIAVKRLFLNNRIRAADFYNEVNIVSSIEHKNLVRLLGCSCSGPESILVYEFVPNMSLDLFIFGNLKHSCGNVNLLLGVRMSQISYGLKPNI
ncbi:cysteine-rich receptor-like protein kinase 2 [Bidens hawaiensis]|uniref:cysteine-rich receptor-like protein kinase 2 n=1 Tax=Bidens hawaiensis TaxID=980011 RepID=UPI00404A5036